MTTEDMLLERYGPLLTLRNLAEVLHRSPDGLRITLSSGAPCAERLNRAKVRIGRRVYFRTVDIAMMLGASDGL